LIKAFSFQENIFTYLEKSGPNNKQRQWSSQERVP